MLTLASQAALGEDDPIHPYLFFFSSQNKNFDSVQALGSSLCTLHTGWRWWPRAALILALLSLLLPKWEPGVLRNKDPTLSMRLL